MLNEKCLRYDIIKKKKRGKNTIERGLKSKVQQKGFHLIEKMFYEKRKKCCGTRINTFIQRLKRISYFSFFCVRCYSACYSLKKEKKNTFLRLAIEKRTLNWIYAWRLEYRVTLKICSNL